MKQLGILFTLIAMTFAVAACCPRDNAPMQDNPPVDQYKH